jgi:uncharacterized sporulation protein YeaH/YhbH (DUF444 family)
MDIIDRRLNPQGKSLANRQRFIRRAKEQITRAVRDASAGRNLRDLANGDKISISKDGIAEPTFRKGPGGKRDIVVPGNKSFQEGDAIDRPGGGKGGRGRQAGDDGSGEDDFQFVISREEFIDLFLEDLELPDLAKRKLKQTASFALRKAGFSSSGSPSNLNLVRTMRNGMARRIALKRPKPEEIEEIRRQLAALDEAGSEQELSSRRDALLDQLARAEARSRTIPWLDPVDVRYNRFEKTPKPVTQAVMFCLMDVSGSVTEHMKDLAKRFFMLLNLFLTRQYEHVDLVFIRHTHEAKDVDEETFFRSRETGGTVVSTALELMQQIIAARYPVADWNIYSAQASDGDNMSSDRERTASLMRDVILPAVQHHFYVEVADRALDWAQMHGGKTDLWRTYESLGGDGVPLSMQRVSDRSEIFPVFRAMFKKSAG